MTNLDLYEIARFAGLSSEQVPGLKRFMDAYAEQAVERERAAVVAHAEKLAAQSGRDLAGRISGDTLRAFAAEVKRADHVGGKGET